MSARDALCLGLWSFAVCSCTCLTEPGSGAPAQAAETQTAAPVPAPAPAPPADAPPNDAANEQIAAAHILIAYKGAMRAAPAITRSKEDAQKLAGAILAQAKAGKDFGDLAISYSDDPSAKQNRGSLGKFSRNQMVKPFADAAFALNPGGISSIVETPFGFHVIKRTE